MLKICSTLENADKEGKPKKNNWDRLKTKQRNQDMVNLNSAISILILNVNRLNNNQNVETVS